MSTLQQLWLYYATRLRASRDRDADRGEVSATTVVLAAALVALAIAVGVILTQKVRQKADGIDLD